MMTIADLDRLGAPEALAELARCCGSRRWSERMIEARPFGSREALLAAADRIWGELEQRDWLEAFGHHPRIGGLSELRAKFASTADWARQEQAGAAAASDEILKALAAGNAEYEARFGRVFLVCATGKGADDILALLRARLANSPEQELRIAAQEQAKITRIRLEKLIAP